MLDFCDTVKAIRTGSFQENLVGNNLPLLPIFYKVEHFSALDGLLL
jgi:hypothetical protein